MMDVVMGVDMGTTGVRAVLFDRDGTQVGLAYEEVPMLCTQPGMSELDPEGVFRATLSVMRRVLQESGGAAGVPTAGAHEAGAPRAPMTLQAIGFSTQMHSFLAVDGEGTPLTNVLTWADSRPLPQSLELERRYDAADLYRRTGCRVQHPSYPLSKILWLKATRPDAFAAARRFLTLKSYVLFRLYGVHVADRTDASCTALLGIRTFRWDDDILHGILEIGADRLPEVVDCTFLLRGMRKEYADHIGIPADLPVAAGSGDGILANLGCGVIDDTAMSCTIGTSGALRVAVGEPLLDPHQRTWCYCFTQDTWVAGGAVNNGGLVLRWLRDLMREQFSLEADRAGVGGVYALFDRYAREIPPGSDGLLFLPLLTGDRSPDWNASARGLLAGMDLSHDRRHLVRAAMEGVLYRMMTVYEVLASMNDRPVRIMANGGYVSSDIWLQIQADLFGKEIAVAGVEEASAFGAAYLAMAATGMVPDLRHPLPAMAPRRTIRPDEANHEIYRKGLHRFKDLYRRMYGR